MSALRSPTTIAAALLAAVTAYAYVAVHGTPRPFMRLASLGASGIEARGGVELEARIDGGHADQADPIARVLRERLEAIGVDASIARTGHDALHVVAVGAPPERADAIAAALSVRGELSLRAEIDTGDDLARVAAAVPPGTTGVVADVDRWTPEDSSRQVSVPFLRADERAPLIAATAHVALEPGHELLLERVESIGDAGRHPYYRTHVVARDAVIGNADVERATAKIDEYTERAAVLVELTRDGGERFGDWTAAHVGHKLVIVVDGQITSAPIVNTPIRGGQAVITMGAGDPHHRWDQAGALAAALAAREVLPAPITVHVLGERPPSFARLLLGRALVALAAALLVLAIAWGLGRWSALAAAPRPIPAPRGPRRTGELAGRLAVTIAVPVALAWLARQDVPGLDADALGDVPPGVASVFPIHVGALGILSVIDAYVLVELVALCVPALRRLRHGDRSARRPLVIATTMLATIGAIVQAYLVSQYLISLGITDAHWLVTAVLAGGVAASALGAAAIERWGAGNGWSVLIASGVIQELFELARAADQERLVLLLGTAALAGLVAVAAARTIVRSPRGAMRLPIGGVAGAAVAPSVLAVLVLLVILTRLDATSLIARLDQPIALLASGAVLAALLAAAWSRRLGRGARIGAIVLSAAIALAVVALGLLIATAPSRSPALGLVLGGAFAAAALADVAGELRARASGAWTEVARLHDVEAADELLTAGPAFARGLHVRALYRFFAPFVPIVVYEPAGPLSS